MHFEQILDAFNSAARRELKLEIRADSIECPLHGPFHSPRAFGQIHMTATEAAGL